MSKNNTHTQNHYPAWCAGLRQFNTTARHESLSEGQHETNEVKRVFTEKDTLHIAGMASRLKTARDKIPLPFIYDSEVFSENTRH